MSGMGIKFEDESWETFKVSITNSTLNGVVSLQMVKGSVLNEEIRRKAQGSLSQSKGEVRKRKEKRVEVNPSPDTRMWSVTTITKQGICRSIENKGKKGKSKEKDDDYVTIAIGDDLVILQDFESIIDSGATLHITSRKEFFTSYIASDFGVLKMDNDGVTKVISVSDVCLQTNTRMQLLSHISEKGLNCLAKNDMLSGLKNAELEKCSHCMVSKQTRVSFKKHPPSRKSELLELVHSDVCDPLKVKSFSGAFYFVTFIDDCSTKLWVYVLKTKDQVLEKFKQFQALVERQSGKKGIRHEKTPPKTPQLNGLAKRMNMILIERVRCMLFEARLPKQLWGEAFYTTMHAINLNLAVSLNTGVPDKIWFGKDVKYDHLQDFDCKAFVHVPKDERSKLDMKTRQCIFIGYGHDEYGYRMYDPVEKKLVRSRDVQFMEDQTIENIDAVKKSTLEKDNSLFEIDLVRMPVHDLDTVDNNVQNGDQHNYVGD
ncbi:hypothetical protein CR513_30024, partial [Mucuna pruriens]